MARTAPHVVYLDTSILTAWLKDEDRPNDQMLGVYECFERIRKWEIQAIVSSLCYAEIDVAQYPPDRQTEFYRLLSERNPQEVSIDTRVCRLAGKLRWFYRDRSMKLETPDALHLAAAIHYEAVEFYVFDDGVEKKRTSLIDLSGTVGGHALAILKPPVTRPRLDFRRKPSADKPGE